MKNEIERISNLLPMEKGILFHTFKNRDKSMYFEQLTFKILGDFNTEIAEKSLNSLIQKHETTRTVFIFEKISSPKKVILKHRTASIKFFDITNEVNKAERIEEIKNNDIKRGFNLSKDILLRMTIIRLNVKENIIILGMHHIISDGWSLGIILNDFFGFYRQIESNTSVEFEKNSNIEYEKWIEAQNQSDANKYWKKYLENYDGHSTFPYTIRNMNLLENIRGEECIEIDKKTSKLIAELGKEKQITSNIIFQIIWGILLCKYNDTNDIVYGTIVSGRKPHIRNMEKLTGLFINNIPIRIIVEENDTFSSIANRMKIKNNASEEYSYFPLVKIQNLTKQKSNLINNIIVFENYPIDKSINEGRLHGFQISDVEIFEKTNYNFTLIIIPGDEIKIRAIYNKNRISTVFAKNTLRYYKNILEEVIKNPNINVNRIKLMSCEETEELKKISTGKTQKIHENQTIENLFFNKAKEHENKIAVSKSNELYSYDELNILSDKVLSALKSLNIVKGDKVGLLMQRSIDIVAAILGIVKSGATIVPIPIEYPQKRIKYIIADSKIKLIINNIDSKDASVGDTKVLCMANIHKQEHENHLIYNTNINDPLYIIYTSGTTGAPKGVILKQKNLINLIKSQEQNSNINFKCNTLQFASIGFDVSFQEIFQTLLAGGTLYIADENMKKNPIELFKYIEKNRIEIVYLPTSFLNVISGYDNYSKIFPKSIKHIIVAGEELILNSRIEKIIFKNNIKIHNHYGPTETHVATTHIIDKNNFTLKPPIGSPINNSAIYVMDRFAQLQPKNIEGELFISGDCVGEGYINNIELTKDKFITDPFNNNKMMYKTGDRAIINETGLIEYLGRNDNQIKIRGFRVELSEIEANIHKIDSINEIKAVLDDNKIIAFFTANEKISVESIINKISFDLPDYMIPNEFYQVDQIHLNHNGKVDYTRLLKTTKYIEKIDINIPIENVIQRKLKNIWEIVLDKKNIGIIDDFFEIGGDSLLVMRACGLAYKYDMDLDPQIFYDCRNIKNISIKIQDINTTETIENKIIINTNTTINSETNIKLSGDKNKIKNVLVTGSTGFLGAHIVDELVNKTESNIYCLVRGKDMKESITKFQETMYFYFKDKYTKLINDRVFILNGDLSKPGLGLEVQIYLDLGREIDTIFHAAALVTFIGDYADFEKVNVYGTNQIVKLALKFNIKLNHISTTGVSGDRIKQEKKNLIFSENDLDIGQNYFENVYLRSKFNGEKIIKENILIGLNASIFRVGFITSRCSDGLFQKNPEENAFYGILRILIQYGIITKTIIEEKFEFTPVDMCSKAIVAISKTIESKGKTFHLKNHNKISINNFFKLIKEITGKEYNILDITDFKAFIEYISLNKSISEDDINVIINEFNFNKSFDENYRVKIDSQYTIEYLKQLDFQWGIIDIGYIHKVLKYLKDISFVKLNDEKNYKVEERSQYELYN